MAITDKREIERRVKNVKLRAVILKNRVLDVKKSTGVDLRDEIIEYLEDRFEEKENERNNESIGKDSQSTEKEKVDFGW